MPQFYLTKYALTRGILKVEGEINELGRLRYTKSCSSQPYISQRGDFYDNEDDAKVKAERLRLSRLKHLKKTIANLEKKTF